MVDSIFMFDCRVGEHTYCTEGETEMYVRCFLLRKLIGWFVFGGKHKD